MRNESSGGPPGSRPGSGRRLLGSLPAASACLAFLAFNCFLFLTPRSITFSVKVKQTLPCCCRPAGPCLPCCLLPACPAASLLPMPACCLPAEKVFSILHSPLCSYISFRSNKDSEVNVE